MTTDVYNVAGKVVGSVELPERVFARPWNPDLVHQALEAQSRNGRSVVAHAKSRGEVSGGGKKPWRQKGTGRARHGSIRSPIWKGGGVTHGPTKERVFGVKLNKKMRQGALFSALSKKLADGEVRIIDSLADLEPKTKALRGILSQLAVEPKAKKVTTLIIPASETKSVYRAAENMAGVKSLAPTSLNVYDLLRYKELLVERGAIEAINLHYHAL